MKLTVSADPIKLYEYLASGKPIISTDLPEVRKFAHLIGIADGVNEFERSIEIALKEDSPDRARARQAVAAENSWDNRFQMMMNIIQERRETLGI
jgi:glycosyltransferase involved in cell wall biosynthesis